MMPVLQFFRKYSTIILYCLIVVGLLQYILIRFQLMKFSWIYLYAFGYFYANASDRAKLSSLFISLFIFILVSLRIDMQVITDYYGWQNRVLHDYGGFLLFTTGYYLFQCIPDACKVFYKYIGLADKYSYPIYITHHIFIFGPLSLLSATPYLTMNVVLILSLSFVTAAILNIISNRLLGLYRTIRVA